MNYVVNKKMKKLGIFEILVLIEGCAENLIELSSFCEELS